MGPKSNDKSPCERHTEETPWRRGRGEGRVEMEAETGEMQPQIQEAPEPPEVRRGKEGSPLELSERARSR